MALRLLFHPLPLFLCSNITVTFTAAYTDRGSPLRYVALGLLFLLANVFPASANQFTKTTGWAGRVPAGAVFWNCVTCFDRLILRNWDYCHYGPPKGHSMTSEMNPMEQVAAKNDAQFSGSRMDFGSEISGLARGIGRFWQVKNVPHFAEQTTTLVPTMGAFMLVQGFAIVLCYYINNFTVALTFDLDPGFLGSEHIPLLMRLPNVTVSELRARAVASIGYWIVQFCNMQFFYSLFSLIGAIFSPDEIKLWRPLFGNFKDAYTLRNFWGKSWHQTLRSGLEEVSNFFTHDVFQLHLHGTLQRYTKIFFSFALSGIMHIFADMGGGISMGQSGALQFFCMQALGIMIEDGVQEMYSQLSHGTKTVHLRGMERIVGYAWVLFFLIWTSPGWIFPVTLQMKKDEALLSWTALKPLFRGLSK